MTDRLDLEAIPVEVSCDRCEGDGAYSKLADCTTCGPDCACNGPRVLVDPCDHCGGSGFDVGKCVALITEVERLQAEVERKDKALGAARDFLADEYGLDYEGDEAADPLYVEFRVRLLVALAESEEQAVSRSERGTEGVGLSGETAQQNTSGGSDARTA